MSNGSINVNAIANRFQPRNQASIYANTVGLDSDLLSLDCGLMNYGGCYGTGGLDTFNLNGMYGTMGMMGGGLFGAGMYGYDPNQYLNYQKQMNMGYMQMQSDMEDYQMKRQIDRTKKQDAAQFSIGATNNVVDEKLEILKRQISNNEQDHVTTDHAAAVAALKEKLQQSGYGTNITDEQVSAYMNRLYEQKYHKSIAEDLEENGDSQFVYGLKQGLDPLGLFTNKKSARQNISDLTGQKLSPSEISDVGTGKTVGYLGLGVATVGAFIALPYILKGGCKGGGGVGKLIINGWKGLFSKAPKVKA